ncbi:DUF4132 domain-containing protein [Catenulispora subtropica]|uniref:WGR and DUF4132 domain-containing protein n=1 Tax=Catenulispora subtropica TaxID=450798 RepID=A0ABP5BMW7_9ACTN
MTGATPVTASPPEDVCELPTPLRLLVIPRRGGSVDEPLLDPRAAARHESWLTENGPRVTTILDDVDSQADLVEAYRTSPDGLAEATPIAAAIEAAVAISPATGEYTDPTNIVDVWVSARGIAFATAAAVELFGVGVCASFATGRRGDRCLRRRSGVYGFLQDSAIRFALAARLRQHLAAASDADYAQATEILTDYRASLPARDLATGHQYGLTSFLMPEHADWVDAELAAFVWNHKDALTPWLLLCALTTDAHVAAFPASSVSVWSVLQEPRALATAVDSLGAGLLPILVSWSLSSGPDVGQQLLAIVVCLPSTEAFEFLVDNIDKKNFTAAVLSASKNFPRRALRVLADAARHETPRGLAAAAMLRHHVLADEDLVRDELPNLAPTARALVEGVLAANVRVPDADPRSLPALFVDPPWAAGAKPAKPVVISGLTAPTETVMAWREGEKEEWASRRIEERAGLQRDSWEVIAKKIATGTSARWYEDAMFAVDAPEELVRPVLALWQPDSWQSETWVRGLVARFGADALPPVLYLAQRQPKTCSDLLAPFAAPEAALLAAEWLSRVKSARPRAMAWLARHSGVAARTLIPVALGKTGKARNAAELTLRTLAARGYAPDIAEAAAEYGEAAAKAIAAIVADDGTLTLPRTMPALPDWADTRVLPQVLLKGRQRALPAQAVGYLTLMLAVSKPAEPYAGVLVAKEICDPASLTGFAWALFENWRGADYPPKENWAFEALRWFGDDSTVRQLAPMIRLWPGESGHQRAVAGLDILAGIGGNTALLHLYGISQKVAFKGLREQAAQRITEIADNLGLTSEQLGDRLVPDLGLDSSGTLLLDYGPRRFTVGFDEVLKPCVADESGKRLKALPKPGTKDDAELAPAAYQRFSGLKKDVRTLAADQIARFETAMVTQRRWTTQEFTEYFTGHPLLRHIVRRLVWATFEDERPVTAFRIAEDLSSADVSDDEYHLPDDATVGIAHPLHLGEDLPAWADMFADYEILQPFAQLGRSVHTLTDEEKASSDLTRFHGIEVPIGKVLGMERRGWHRGMPLDAGVQRWIYRMLPNGGSVTVDLDPGIAAGYVSEFGQIQKFEAVFIDQSPTGNDYSPGRTNYRTFATLADITASELLRDLTEVTAR